VLIEPIVEHVMTASLSARGRLPEFVMGAGASLAVWAPLPLRLIVGYGFMAHGMAKLGRGPEHFTGILDAIGLPLPALFAWLTIIVEVAGGFAVLLGLGVVLASLPMAVILVVAMVTVHLPYGFSSIKLLAVTPSGAQFGMPGYETDLLYLAALAALVLGGSGPFALDNVIRRVIGRRSASGTTAVPRSSRDRTD
jgi:putative oxidoreductase